MNYTTEPDSYHCLINTEELVPPIATKQFAAKVVRIVYHKTDGEQEELSDFPIKEYWGDDERQAFQRAHAAIRDWFNERGVDPTKVTAF